MKRAQISGEDKPRNLPSDVLDLVLGYFPLEEVVMTSSLSKDWRYKWVTRPNLSFDLDFFWDFIDDRANSIIYQILLLHKGPLLSFTLHRKNSEQGPPFPSSPDVDHWMLFLSSKNIQELKLCMYSESGYEYHLHSSFFTFQHLRLLYLSGCLFRPPPGFQGFDNLTKLNLGGGVSIGASVIRDVISNSPLLEELLLHKCTHFEILEITSTSLHQFEFTGTSGSIRLNAPKLRCVSVSLDATPPLTPNPSFNVTTFFQNVPALEILSVCCSTLKYLFRDVLEDALEGALECLNSVASLSISLGKAEEVLMCFVPDCKLSQLAKALCEFRSVY